MSLNKTKMDSILNITPKRGVLALLVLSILYLNASTRDNFVTDVRRGLSIDGPQIKRSDFIMRGAMDAPIVVEEFKLVFFIIPKVACSEWKHLFSRMMGKADLVQKQIHFKHLSGIKNLNDYSLEETQIMMTSDDWTRAVFLREPKERLLSTFLDKFVNQRHFHYYCCRNLPKEELKVCDEQQTQKNFTYFLERTKDCHDPHWKPQRQYIDEKWWPSINYIGYQGNLEYHVVDLLQRLKSSKDGQSAWKKYGRTGWGENGNGPFLHKDVAPHATHAHDKLRKWYTRCDEKFVEKFWSMEWNSSVYGIRKRHLYNPEGITNTSKC